VLAGALRWTILPADKRSAAVTAEPPPDTRPTIVFLHGTVLSGAAWTAQVTALGDAFHCLAPDLPGHGTQRAVPFTIDRAVEQVVALIDREAHDGRAILVGLSLGGYVAMTVAARWPERVAGLAIAGATADPVGLQSLGFRGLAFAFETVPEPVLEAAYRWFFRWRFRPGIADPIVAAGLAFAGSVVALRSLVGERFSPRLAAYPGPSLLINGEYDLFFRPTEPAFADAAANPRRALIRRAIHLSNLDQPERFSRAIHAFAVRVSVGPTTL
jgi:pimeloyl-ACP methyl ester carboxylesterase